MIYIDPPYNTGRDFVYHDNFTVKKTDYSDNTIDAETGAVLISEDEYVENSKANGRFHSDWLSMMLPRLKLARNLLTEDGAIFISIDDNEYHNLKSLCDEIYGEDNYVATLIWNTKNASKGVPPIQMVTSIHEYVLVYARNGQFFKFNGIARTTDDFSNPDNDPRGLWRKEALVSTISQKSFEITDPKTGNKFNRPWAFSRETLDKMIAEGRVLFPPTESGTPLQKKFFNDYTNDGVPITTQLGTYQTRKATSDLIRLFDGKKIFDFSKPTELIKFLIEQGTKNGDIVLDFFAGSGTTGHSIIEMNKKGDERRFILAQLDEATDAKSEANKAGYATIDQITIERLKRIGKEADGDTDSGFRVFRIDSSNEKDDIRKPLKEVHQGNIFDMIDNVKKDRTPLDLLFGIVYTSALPFDLKLETRKIDNNTVYLYGYFDKETGLIACFDDEVPEETVKEIAELRPLTAAFRDSSFKDSAEKINLSEYFRIISPNTKIKVI